MLLLQTNQIRICVGRTNGEGNSSNEWRDVTTPFEQVDHHLGKPEWDERPIPLRGNTSFVPLSCPPAAAYGAEVSAQDDCAIAIDRSHDSN